MINTGELSLANSALKDLQREWRIAIVNEPTSEEGESSEPNVDDPLPLEGRIWFSLVATRIAISGGKIADACQELSVAG